MCDRVQTSKTRVPCVCWVPVIQSRAVCVCVCVFRYFYLPHCENTPNTTKSIYITVVLMFILHFTAVDVKFEAFLIITVYAVELFNLQRCIIIYDITVFLRSCCPARTQIFLQGQLFLASEKQPVFQLCDDESFRLTREGF